MSYPTRGSASGIWKLNEARNASMGGSWPTTTSGLFYAQSYIAQTGGSLITVSVGGNVRAAIDSSLDGDAVLIDEGTYSVGTSSVGSAIHGGKEILIAGNTDIPQNVVIDYNHDVPEEIRDHPVFKDDCNTTNTQLAFLTFYRNPTNTISTNYNSTLVQGNSGTTKGIAINVYFDLDDKLVAWNYDNSNNTTHDVRFLRCTFANYSSWVSSYSGSDGVIDVGNCLFDDSTITTEYINLGNNFAGAVVDTANRSYNTLTYPTAGHLYIPNTTAVF